MIDDLKIVWVQSKFEWLLGQFFLVSANNASKFIIFRLCITYSSTTASHSNQFDLCWWFFFHSDIAIGQWDLILGNYKIVPDIFNCVTWIGSLSTRQHNVINFFQVYSGCIRIECIITLSFYNICDSNRSSPIYCGCCLIESHENKQKNFNNISLILFSRRVNLYSIANTRRKFRCQILVLFIKPLFQVANFLVIHI